MYEEVITKLESNVNKVLNCHKEQINNYKKSKTDFQ